MRVSELCYLKLDDVWLEEGMLKVLGKGNKERLIPTGKQVQRCLWRYTSRFRPEPLAASGSVLFLTQDGKPLTKDRVEKIMARYGQKAGLKGVRCLPHTLRYTAAVKFLRNGGDVFSLQRMLGHASLEMANLIVQRIPKTEPSFKEPNIADRVLGPMADIAGKQMANMFGRMFGFNTDEQMNGGQPQVPSGWEYEDKGGAEQ